MKIWSISSALGLFTLCVLASPVAFAVDWQTAIMEQVDKQNDQWIQEQVAAAVDKAKLSGIKDSLTLGKIYDDALAKAEDSIAAQMEIQMSQVVSWAPETIPTTYIPGTTSSLYGGSTSYQASVTKAVTSSTANIVNVDPSVMKSYAAGTASSLYGGSTSYSTSATKTVSSLSKLLGNCQSQYVNELGKSACGDVSLSALESFLSKLQ